MNDVRISKREAATILGVTPQSVANLTERGALSVVKVGKWNYYNYDEVMALVPKAEGIRNIEGAIAEVEAELERTRGERVSEVMMHRARREFIEKMTDVPTFHRYQELVSAVYDTIEGSGLLGEKLTMRERDIIDEIIHLRPIGEIAQRYGLTEVRTRQIFERALRRMVHFSTDISERFYYLERTLEAEREANVRLCRENEMLKSAAKAAPAGDTKPWAIVDTKIRELSTTELLPRTANCLVAGGCVYVRDILSHRPKDFMRFRNFGARSMRDLEGFLKRHGLDFGMTFTTKADDDEAES